MEATFLMVVAEFSAAVLTDLRRLLYSATDAERPTGVVFDLGGFDVSVMDVLRSLTGKAFTASGAQVAVQGPGLDEVLLELGQCLLRRASAGGAFDQAVAKHFGSQDWPTYCLRIAAMPAGTAKQALMATFREVVVIDLTIVLIAKVMENESAAKFGRKPGKDGALFQRLVALGSESGAMQEYLELWCQLLDADYHVAPGTFYVGVRQYLQQLD
jgi:hypothetical protein